MLRAIVLHQSDNVGTLLDAGRSGETCALQGAVSGTVLLLQDIPFGHKVCLADTMSGADVLKYGQVIGRASQSLKVGEHLHVHNIESARARGDLHEDQ